MASYDKSAPYEIRPNDEYIYYDLTLSNIDSENQENRNILTFTDKRDTPIINKINEYKMSVTRFELSTWTLPVFYFQAKKNSNDCDEGIYSITLEYVNGGLTISGLPERVFFINQDKSKNKPAPPNTFIYGIPGYDEYYYVYNYNNFITMINNTFDLAFTKLQGLVGAPIALANAPFLVWNDNLTATLYCDFDYYDITNTEHIKIYFNRPLYSLFNSFPSFKFTPNSTGKHYQILTHPRNGLNVKTIVEVGPQTLIFTNQEYPTQESWSPIDSIVFTTTMPIVSSVQSNPCIFENGQQLAYSTTYNNSQVIISDFQTSEFNYRSTIYYVPSAEYRYISFLNNNTPLKEIVIYTYVKDRYGILRPFYLPSNSHASIKILFKRI